MPNSYWMVVTTLENFEITRKLGFTIQGLKPYHRRKVQRIGPGDQLLYYLTGIRRFAATATITSKYFEDQTPVWKEEGGDSLAFRVKIQPKVVLREEQFIDASEIAPRMEYVRRWTPEDWHMAFLGNLHLIPKSDFALIEGEMRRLLPRSPSGAGSREPGAEVAARGEPS